eukprot:CAMPEP_0175163842 /NCGR_PEP_ID=MMETSP0087-20121206/26019_1 /TAXON_ID=136419 /ORGANISM="Unknown Unknown, Strain D1" /LENGTH=187 /DNA_ID=CAMNT_0016452681 /DNA_START=1 /DNA_END=564 /DNA_ORIENTATION=-
MAPSCILLFRKGMIFESMLGYFTMFTSFMYHFTETVETRYYMNPGQWHRLDNIGAITCFATVFIYLMANQSKQVDDTLKFVSLWVITIMQEKAPWDILYTVLPILVFVSWPVCKWAVIKKEWPPYHWGNFRKGVGFLVLAFVCFLKGLDEKKDYLRIFHGCWHMLVGATSFYLFQVVKPQPQKCSVL